MKKITILSLTFLAVFILLIFKSSFCWASTDPVIEFFDYGIDNIVTLDNSNGDFDGFDYCVILPQVFDGSTYYCFAISQSPIYLDNNGVSSGYNNLNSSTQVYYWNSTILPTEPVSLSSLSHNQYSGFTFKASGIIYSNNIIYTDSTLETSSDIYTLNSSFYKFSSGNYTMTSVINDMSTSLGLDVLYDQFNNLIPIIVIFVLFVLGFLIVRILLKGTSKGKF